MKSSKSVMKKSKVMDYTNYAYNEAVGRLKLMLADSYTGTAKCGFGGGSSSMAGAYLRNYSEDSADNFSDNISVIERPVYSDISKYLSPSQKTRFGSSYRSRKPLSGFSASKENLAATSTMPPMDYLVTSKPQLPADSVQAPVEIFNFIEKQEDYIEQLEKESKYCRNELTNLLGKVKDVINENEQLTETARSELAALSGVEKSKLQLSPSSEDSEATVYAAIKKPMTPRKKDTVVKSPRYANAPSIVYEARISELEAELTQANIDLKRLRTENEELKRKLAYADPVATLTGSSNNQLVSVVNCDIHRKQIENLQMEKQALEDTVRHLQKSLDEAKSQQYNVSSKRYINDLLQMERSQAELEVKHLRDELDRQHERVRELQHEMARRIAEERANAERRYNNQVDQLGGDLSNQWEQVAKLQLDLERQKRYETDLKRDLANRNAQIEELKMELRSNRSTFLADMAQTNAEKQSFEQEITALRLQLDRAARETKTDAARYNAELNSLRQRLDRADADLLHSKREVLRSNDEIANLEKELAYGEMKNEIRPTKKDLDKRISELQDKHAETVNELEQMIQSQKQLMDKLTTECKSLTNKLEDTTLKHKTEISSLQSNVEYLTNRMITNDRLDKVDTIPTTYSSSPLGKASLDYKPSMFNAADTTTAFNGGAPRTTTAATSGIEDYSKPPGSSSISSTYNYDRMLGNNSASAVGGDILGTTPNLATTTAASAYDTTSYEHQPSTIDATIGDYKSSYNSKYGLGDHDDENLKDNIGASEKQQQQQQQQHKQPIDNEPLKASSYDIVGKEQPTEQPLSSTAATALVDPNMGATDVNATVVADYSAADYSAYEGYDPSQYDPSQYDPTQYDQSQYDASQYAGAYDATVGQGYDPNAAYGDYSAADYDPSAYQQYEQTVAADSTAAAAAAAAIPAPTTTTELIKSSPPTPASTTTNAPATGSATAAAAVPTLSTGRSAATEGRTQSRAGAGSMGSASGSSATGKSASASKK